MLDSLCYHRLKPIWNFSIELRYGEFGQNNFQGQVKCEVPGKCKTQEEFATQKLDDGRNSQWILNPNTAPSSLSFSFTVGPLNLSFKVNFNDCPG
jgi:hypothetical protein